MVKLFTFYKIKSSSTLIASSVYKAETDQKF